MPRTLLLVSLITSVLLGSLQAADPVTVTLTAKKVVVSAEHRETTEPAGNARPGDTLLYEAACRNNTEGTIRGLQATVPIPAGVEFIPQSTSVPVKGGALTASLDGKDFGALPLLHTTKQADGKTAKTPVPPGEYRAVRWSIPEIAAGATLTVSLRAKVLTNQPAAK